MYEQHWQSKKLTKKNWAKNDPSPPYRATVGSSLLKVLPPPPQCLEASTFSPFSKCFGNRFFCIFCKPYTYSHPFLTTLVSFKKIWPIYGYSHFWKPKNEQNWPQIWNYRKRRISGSQVPNMIGFYWTHPKLKILDQKCQLVLKKTWFLSHFVMKKYQILSFFLGYMPETLRNYSSVTFHAINIQNRHQV